MGSASYTSVPTTIEAIQWDGIHPEPMAEWMGDSWSHDTGALHSIGLIYVAANDKWLEIEPGEWVARDELGFYPIKDAVFTKKYRLTPMETGQDMGGNLEQAAEFFPQHKTDR
jgi:hypothetical protein